MNDRKLSDVARERIAAGESRDALVHSAPLHLPLEERDELSSSITLEDYQRGGYVATYRTLGEIEGGCWD